MMAKLYTRGAWCVDMRNRLWRMISFAKNAAAQISNRPNQRMRQMTEVYSLQRGHVTVFWQIPKNEDEIIGEPAIVLKAYSDVIELRQQDKTIFITRLCVPEFIRAIQKVNREE